jgi:hypothetical protein
MKRNEGAPTWSSTRVRGGNASKDLVPRSLWLIVPQIDEDLEDEILSVGLDSSGAQTGLLRSDRMMSRTPPYLIVLSLSLSVSVPSVALPLRFQSCFQHPIHAARDTSVLRRELGKKNPVALVVGYNLFQMEA